MVKALQDITENYNKIPIMRQAHDKIMRYAKLMKSNEVYGFLLSPKDKYDGVIYDAIVAKEQEVSGGHAHITGEAAGKAKTEIENMGCKGVGFWHSHGDHSAFHSGTDDYNLDHLLGTFAANNEIPSFLGPRNYRLIDEENGRIIYRTENFQISVGLDKDDVSYESKSLGDDYLRKVNGELNLKMGLTEDNRLIVKDGSSYIVMNNPKIIEFEKPDTDKVSLTGIAYSVVVNRRGESYAELAKNFWCSLCQKDEVELHKDVGLKVIGGPEKISEASLKKDLKERVVNEGLLKRIFK